MLCHSFDQMVGYGGTHSLNYAGVEIAPVKQEHYAEKQDQRGSDQREDSVVEGTLAGLSKSGSCGVAEGAALSEGALGRSEYCQHCSETKF
jgi:hypothetical protein